ncbi:MAG TPA: anti-sigma regulatory factor [Polyangiaceae bacterium]|nr:anti-sigma regulatory factor [Polyangiaceae bacterium]
MSTETSIAVECEQDIVTARQKGRELAALVGFSHTDQTLLATAISEVARNIVNYAGIGTIVLSSVEDQGRSGIMIVAQDHGPGIADIELAMRDGFSTGNSLGVGLPGTKRLVDDFELTSTLGVGTTVTLKKWLR